MKVSECEKNWISIYLYDSDSNSIITNFIDPFVKKYDINEYFFIRYVDKDGAHVRFRINADNSDDEAIKKNLKKHIENSTIHKFKFEEYIPEVDRYGGKFAIKIAEDFFCFTSELAINMISENSPWVITKAQSLILQLYFIFFKTIDVNKNSMKWMFKIIDNNQWNKSTENLLGLENKKMIFEEAFNKNLEKILLIKSTIHLQIQNEDTSYFKNFIDKINEIENKLDKLINENLIDFGDNSIISFGNEKKSFIKTRLYISYLHMINNRLGLTNHDEAFIFYILKKTMEDELYKAI